MFTKSKKRMKSRFFIVYPNLIVLYKDDKEKVTKGYLPLYNDRISNIINNKTKDKKAIKLYKNR